MKHQISPRLLRAMAAITMLALSAMSVVAQNSTTSQNTPAVPASVGQAVPQLSFGVPEVLKLSQAKIGEDTIISYVQNSGTSYGGMRADEIVYLREQGVSDRVVTTMLNQRKQLTEAAAQTTTQPATVAPATTATASADANTAQYPKAYVQPSVTYVQPAPVSTVYVVPDSPRYVDYGYYPSGYYGYGYPYPAVSFSFGYGGYYGGGYHGGGYHGGGGHGGGVYNGGGSRGGGGHHR
jgi:hypothetical protein